MCRGSELDDGSRVGQVALGRRSRQVRASAAGGHRQQQRRQRRRRERLRPGAGRPAGPGGGDHLGAAQAHQPGHEGGEPEAAQEVRGPALETEQRGQQEDRDAEQQEQVAGVAAPAPGAQPAEHGEQGERHSEQG